MKSNANTLQKMYSMKWWHKIFFHLKKKRKKNKAKRHSIYIYIFALKICIIIKTTFSKSCLLHRKLSHNKYLMHVYPLFTLGGEDNKNKTIVN